MPPKRQRKRNKVTVAPVELKSSLVGTFHETKATLPPSFDPLQSLLMLKQGVPLHKTVPSFEATDGFELLPILKDQKEDKKDDVLKSAAALLKDMSRSIFKADHPYRTRVGYHSTLTTSGAGLLNTQWPVSAVTSSGEWTSIDALFDEVFVHSMTVKFIPRNRLDGAFAFTPTGQAAPVIETTGATTTSTIWNAGIIMASLFVGSGAYTSASAMVANPNHKTAHTCKPFKYVWRNNTRFSPHGLQIATANSQGWCLIGSVGSVYGGYVQFRAVNDVVLGTGASAVTLADMETVWDVSFRSRA